MNELNQTLREQAINLGLCNDWQKLWSEEWSNSKLAEMYFKGIDFALKHHWPSNDFFKKNFTQDFLRESNIFVDDKRSVLNPEKSIVLGESHITFRYNSNNAGNVYVRDNSVVNVTAKGRSFVIVHVFDNGCIKAEQKEKGKVVIIKHSRNVIVDCNDDIKIKEEYDYLN